MIYSHYGIIARVVNNDGKVQYLLRIPDFHTEYGIPDMMYDSLDVARLEATVVLYNCVRLLSHRGHNLPIPMTVPSIHTYAKRWFDDNNWDRENYRGNILIRFRASDMNWDKGPLPFKTPNDKILESPEWQAALARFKAFTRIPVSGGNEQ